SMNAQEFSMEESRFPLSELIAEVIATHSHAAFAHGMRFKLDVPENIELEGDRTHLLCALAHFVSNALNHSAKDQDILISARISSEGLIWGVRDAGPGIAPARLHAIREALQRRESYFSIDAEGIGLGLSLARELAHAHGGRVVIDSIRHKGTVVSLILP